MVLSQKRLAAEILGVGIHRIKIDPEKLNEVKKMLTKDDIRIAIERGWIWAEKEKGTSRVRARKLHEQRKKGRRRGHGSRKGKKTARSDPKRQWINKIRALRRLLRILKEKKIIDRKMYRRLYLMAKGGFFRSRRHLLLWLKSKGIMYNGSGSKI